MICVYEKCDAKHFEIAVESVYNQTLCPDEVVVVGDGPLSDALNTKVDKLKSKHKSLKFFQLKTNRGVGAASNYGIEKCRNDLIAKMDADDVSVPDRIEKQVYEFQSDNHLAALGGQIEEFANNDPNNVVSRREMPLETAEIAKFARRRSPINNPTVMFRKEDVLSVGGYPELNRAEDYYLFAKMIAAKKEIRNLPDVLVKYRLSADNTRRRKSWAHTKDMIHARNQIRKLGVSSWFDFIIMSLSYLALFIMPSSLAETLYKRILRK